MLGAPPSNALMFLQVLTASSIAASAWVVAVGLVLLLRAWPPRLSEVRAMVLLKRANPRDLGLAFRDRTFEVHRGAQTVRLAGWVVPHPEAQGRTVMLVHGYADAKVGAAAWLPMLHRLKVNVVLVDLPGHGESDDGMCTAGWREREDVAQVVDRLRSESPELMKHVVLFGLSMGAAACGGAAMLREGIAGVVMDSPFSDVRRGTVRHSWLFGLPGAMAQRPANWIMGWWLGADFDAIAPRNLVTTVPCPVLLIHGGEDQFITDEDRAEMGRRVTERGDGISTALIVPGAAHLLALNDGGAEYERAVGAFLQRVMRD